MNDWNDLSPFDHERVDAIKKMLVDHVAQRPNPNRPHRIALFVSLIVTAVLVSTGGAALALTGRLPFVEPPAPPAATTPAAAPSTPTPTPTPTPTATVAASTGPVSCDALATPAAVSALLGGTGVLQPFQHLQAGTEAGTPPWSIQNANGTICGWGGLGSLTLSGQHAPQVYLEVVPGLGDQWAALASANNPTAGSHYDGGTSLGGSCGARLCSTEVLVGGAWLHVQAQSDGRSSFTDQAFHDFVQGIVTRYAALPAPTPVVPHALRDCTDTRVLDALSAGLGAAEPDTAGQSEFNLARGQLGSGQVTMCPFAAKGDQHGWNLWVSVLDNVDPALFAQYRQAIDHPDSTALDVSGLPGTATAITEPTVDSTRTTVDVLTGGTWIQLSAYNVTDPKALVAAASKLIASGWIG